MRKLFAVAVSAAVAGSGFVACADASRTSAADDVVPDGGGTGGEGGANEGGVFSSDGAVDSPFGGCAKGTYAAKVKQAAMLFVLDKGGTMAAGGKFAAAQQAIVAASDEATFDTMAIGLYAFPTSNINIQCGVLPIAFPISCGVGGLPQVALNLAGTSKSSASTGVRRDIYKWLSDNSPTAGSGDGKPSYDALKTAINALKLYSMPAADAKRILVFITDGGASCATASAPTRPGYLDANKCADWEYPDSMVTLLKGAHDDVTKPVNSMIVGVPGADTHGENPNTMPPYSVRLSLSAMAFAGSPETTDPTCNGKTFTKTNVDPTKACHVDMTPTFDPAKLSSAIAGMRGNLLGCTFDLPDVGGGILDKDKVNVDSTTDPVKGVDHLKKRKDASDPCTTDGCWDYTADGKVQLIGKACEDVKKSTTAKVEIVVGCLTIVK